MIKCYVVIILLLISNCHIKSMDTQRKITKQELLEKVIHLSDLNNRPLFLGQDAVYVAPGGTYGIGPIQYGITIMACLGIGILIGSNLKSKNKDF